MKLIYIGDHFYWQSGSAMSSLYTEDGRRSDWGFIQTALKNGEPVEIRPATNAERAPYEARLTRMKAEEV